MNESKNRLLKINSPQIMKGCPFNNFGPCKEEACVFFFDEHQANRFLTLIDSEQKATSKIEDRCIMWLIFMSEQESVGYRALLHRGISDFASSRPEHHDFADQPVKALFSVVCDIQQKLESLEKELKKS